MGGQKKTNILAQTIKEAQRGRRERGRGGEEKENNEFSVGRSVPILGSTICLTLSTKLNKLNAITSGNTIIDIRYVSVNQMHKIKHHED